MKYIIINVDGKELPNIFVQPAGRYRSLLKSSMHLLLNYKHFDLVDRQTVLCDPC